MNTVRRMLDARVLLALSAALAVTSFWCVKEARADWVADAKCNTSVCRSFDNCPNGGCVGRDEDDPCSGGLLYKQVGSSNLSCLALEPDICHVDNTQMVFCYLLYGCHCKPDINEVMHCVAKDTSMSEGSAYPCIQ